MISPSRFALVAPLISNVFAQTPKGFQPGTLVNLGVTYPSINIDPVGSAVQSLSQVQTEPVVTVPTTMLLGPNGQPIPGQRFMIMMIDIDVIQNNVATTVLHWFQPDLIMDVGPAPATAAVGGQAGNNTSTPAAGMTKLIRLPGKSDSITGVDLSPNAIGQADYLAPGPPPGPAHRYVEVLLAQPKNFSVPACFKNVLSTPGNPTANAQQRLGFDIKQFMAATGVRTRPIAGSFFLAQNAQPASLTQSASVTALRNAMCPGVTLAAAPRTKFRRSIL